MPSQEKSTKLRWKGIFNFQRELYIEYCYAYSKKQALVVMCRRIAKKQRVIPSLVMNYFDGTKDNYSIQEEK